MYFCCNGQRCSRGWFGRGGGEQNEAYYSHIQFESIVATFYLLSNQTLLRKVFFSFFTFHACFSFSSFLKNRQGILRHVRHFATTSLTSSELNSWDGQYLYFNFRYFSTRTMVQLTYHGILLYKTGYVCILFRRIFRYNRGYVGIGKSPKCHPLIPTHPHFRTLLQPASTKKWRQP